jgi:hypothetical protein
MTTKVHWVCGDCGNMYDENVEACPNTRFDAAVLAKRAQDPEHDPLCPRFRILCDCPDCYPPPCLCQIIDAVRHHDREQLRIAAHGVTT